MHVCVQEEIAYFSMINIIIHMTYSNYLIVSTLFRQGFFCKNLLRNGNSSGEAYAMTVQALEYNLVVSCKDALHLLFFLSFGSDE